MPATIKWRAHSAIYRRPVAGDRGGEGVIGFTGWPGLAQRGGWREAVSKCIENTLRRYFNFLIINIKFGELFGRIAIFGGGATGCWQRWAGKGSVRRGIIMTTTENRGRGRGWAVSLSAGLLVVAMSPLTAAGGDEGSGATGADWRTGWYMAPMLSYTWADNDRRVDDTGGFQFSIGRPVSRHFNLELRGSYTNFNLDRPGGSQKHKTLGLDALWFPDREGRFSPYLLFGAGLAHSKLSTRGDDADQVMDYGVGFTYKLKERGVAWRTDMRFRNEIDSDTVPGATGFDDWVLNTGLVIPIGKQPARRSPVKVDQPVPAVAAPAPAPKPLDSDGDGVNDATDACPATGQGMAVDERGCPKAQTITLQGVEFENNSSILTAAAKQILDEVAATLRNAPQVHAEVAGHTDSVGPDDYNLWLSERRAKAVRQYLVDAGVDAGRLTAKGYGETRPLAHNGTAEGRARNRRVELVVLP